MNTTIKLSLITTLFLSTSLIAEEKLQDITVTSATKTSQNISDVTSNINVITAQEIEERHYTTVTEALNSLPGIFFTSNGGIGKSTALRVRGMDSKHTLILVDGIRYQDPSNTQGASIEHLIITDIERIEVIKGAQSGIWGADATAGVINIITKEAKEGITFSTAQEFGNFNTSKTDLALSYKNKDFYVKTTHTRLDSDGFTSQVTQGQDINDFEDDAYSSKTSSIKAGINIAEDGKLELSHTNIKSLSDYDGFGLPNDESRRADNQMKLSSIHYTQKINNHDIKVKHEISDFSKQERGTVASPYFTQVLNYNGKTTNSEFSDNINYNQNDFLLIGIHKQKTEVDYLTAKSVTNSNAYNNKAIFLTNSNKLTDSTILTESIRHDRYDNFDNKTTGKIGIKHTTDFGLIISSNYGTAYTAPSIIQVLNPFGATNPNLQPEETKSYDISLEHHGMKVTYFNQEIDNLIDWYDPDNFGPIVGKYDNLAGTSKIKGYEVAYNTTLFDTVALSLGYTKLNAKNKNGKDLLRRANQSLKFGIDYYGIEKSHLGLNGEYVGERKDIKFNPDFTSSEVETGKYTVINFSANYEIDKHLSFYGKVDNITDKTYQTVYGYATSPRAAYAGMKLSY